MSGSGKGASVVIVGAGATGLSAGWWLAQDGVDVLVIDKGIVGWEASGRNGGGCSHHFSPLFVEEQRLWPLLDAMLGYPTEFQPHRIRVAFDPAQFALYAQAMRNAARQGFASEILDAAAVAPPGAAGGRRRVWRLLLQVSVATPIRTAPCRPMPGRCRIMAGA